MTEDEIINLENALAAEFPDGPVIFIGLRPTDAGMALCVFIMMEGDPHFMALHPDTKYEVMADYIKRAIIRNKGVSCSTDN